MTLSRTPTPDNNKFKPLYKAHRHLKHEDIPSDSYILDPRRPADYDQYKVGQRELTQLEIDQITNASKRYTGSTVDKGFFQNATALTFEDLPGFTVYPDLLTPDVQRTMIEQIVQDHLPEPRHLSNLTPFYHLPHPFNIFDDSNDPILHKDSTKSSTTMHSIRSKQLRWITLGGQYNWTSKEYPTFTPGEDGFPPFPEPLRQVLHGMFPSMDPEAAIINFYSPGDILSPHQDVAEICQADLVSVSIGCDCVFYVSPSRERTPLAVLLRSGDVVIMGGQSRYAFHGVGRVWGDTCPDYLTTITNDDDDKWPQYSQWLSKKRININVRQMLPR